MDIIPEWDICERPGTYAGGGFSRPQRVNLPGGLDFIVADINGDGIPDLVNSYIYVALGKGNGKFEKPSLYFAENYLSSSYHPVAADLRHSGNLDIISQTGGLNGANGSVSVLYK